jgi:hypothetical protein
LEWFNSIEGERGTEVKYTKSNGEKATLVLSANSSTLKLSDFSASSDSIAYRSFYVPDSSAIDTFATSWSNYAVPFIELRMSKSAWQITGFSSEEPGDGAVRVIDGDINTIWHTPWSSSQPGYPHYFIVDMGETVNITMFEVYGRQNDNRGQIKHQFLVSEDGVNWLDMGTFTINPNTNEAQSYRITSNPVARYFKYVALEGPNFFASLAEINVLVLPK